MRAGFPVYTAFETQSALETITGERTRAIEPMKRFRLGNFTITPFNVPHDPDIECYGYLIEHEEIGKLLFLTDLEYCKYNFKNLMVNHILVEANHGSDFLDRNSAKFKHQITGHMNINTTCEFLRCNNSNMLLNVILLHLSSDCSDEEMFNEMASEIVSCPVYIAKRGLEIDISLLPF